MTRRQCHTSAVVFTFLCGKQWSNNGTVCLDVVREKDGVLPGYTMESGDHLTSPLGDFFLTLQNLLNSFPHKRFMGFISFSFDRRSGLIKGGVRLLTCCVKMAGTRLPKRTQSGRTVLTSESSVWCLPAQI